MSGQANSGCSRLFEAAFSCRLKSRLPARLPAPTLADPRHSSKIDALEREVKFHSEAEERKFWETHDTTAYLDWSRAKVVQLLNRNRPSKSKLTAGTCLISRL